MSEYFGKNKITNNERYQGKSDNNAHLGVDGERHESGKVKAQYLSQRQCRRWDPESTELANIIEYSLN